MSVFTSSDATALPRRGVFLPQKHVPLLKTSSDATALPRRGVIFPQKQGLPPKVIHISAIIDFFMKKQCPRPKNLDFPQEN